MKYQVKLVHVSSAGILLFIKAKGTFHLSRLYFLFLSQEIILFTPSWHMITFWKINTGLPTCSAVSPLGRYFQISSVEVPWLPGPCKEQKIYVGLLLFCCRVCQLSQMEGSSFLASVLDDLVCARPIQTRCTPLTRRWVAAAGFMFPPCIFPSPLSECNISSPMRSYKTGQRSPATLSLGLKFVL